MSYKNDDSGIKERNKEIEALGYFDIAPRNYIRYNDDKETKIKADCIVCNRTMTSEYFDVYGETREICKQCVVKMYFYLKDHLL